MSKTIDRQLFLPFQAPWSLDIGVDIGGASRAFLVVLDRNLSQSQTVVGLNWQCERIPRGLSELSEDPALRGKRAK